MAKAEKRPQITVVDEGDGLLIGGRFKPDFGKPLQHLAIDGARAFAVEDTHGNAEEFFCAMCEPGVYIRHSMMQALFEANPRQMRQPHAAATVRLKDGRHFFAIVFDNARARPLPEVYGGNPPPERDLVQKVLPGAIQCLMDLNAKNLCHRSIRAETILIGPDGDALLDQCVIGLPGEQQPDVYEPVLSALAVPGGRGEGLPADDFFALGVAALHLASGKLPCEGMDPAALQARRIARGSYNTLIDRRKFTSALQALLAGALADEAHRRWGSEDMKAWAAGHWDMPRPSAAGRRAPRPFLFMGRDYHNPELLAWAFQDNTTEAVKVIQSRRVEKWVRNVLEDNQSADLIDSTERLYENAGDEGSDEAYELVSRVCMALDPAGPLRYRDLVISPSGIAGAIWTAFVQDNADRLADLDTLVGTTLLAHWQATGSKMVKTALPLFVTSTIKSIMAEKVRPGFGLERILYEMLPTAACMEPAIRAANPISLGDAILAMERLAETDPAGGLTIGRHLAAFVLAKDKGAETTVRTLSNAHATKAEEVMAAADLLAYLQRNFLILDVPNLTRALGAQMAPAVDDISSKVRRLILTQKIESLSGGGDLTAMVKQIDIKQTLSNDKSERREAMKRLQAIDRLIDIASSNGTAQSMLAQKRGYRYARLFSMSVAFVTVFYFSMVEML